MPDANKHGNKHELKAASRPPLFCTIPSSFSLILCALLCGLMTLPFCYPGYPGPTPKPAAAAPPAVQIEARIRTEGLDKHNRALPFTVYVLSQDVSWKLKSTEDLEGEHPLLSPELVAAVNRAREVFCVGTASYEGAARTEEERAARRAGELARWIGAIVQDAQKTRLFAVNAGQYRGPMAAQSADQRRAIIIATQEHADGVDLGDALYAGLKSIQEGHPIVYGLLHHYSKSNEWLKDSNILEQ